MFVRTLVHIGRASTFSVVHRRKHVLMPTYSLVLVLVVFQLVIRKLVAHVQTVHVKKVYVRDVTATVLFVYV